MGLRVSATSAAETGEERVPRVRMGSAISLSVFVFVVRVRVETGFVEFKDSRGLRLRA